MSEFVSLLGLINYGFVLKMDICQVERHHDTKEKDKAVIDKS